MENSFIDLIIRLKNGYLAENEKVDLPHSKFKEAVVKKLKELGYISDYLVDEEKVKKIVIDLKYKNKVPAMTDVKIYSKPGRRYYVSFKDLRPILNNFGYSILSTSHGILTNKEAKKLKVGGELLFSIW